MDFYYCSFIKNDLRQAFDLDECDDIETVLREIYDSDRDPLTVSEKYPLKNSARVIAEILENAEKDPSLYLEFYIDSEFGNFHVIENDGDRTDAVFSALEMQENKEAAETVIGQLIFRHGISPDLVRKFCPDYYSPETDYEKAYLLGKELFSTLRLGFCDDAGKGRDHCRFLKREEPGVAVTDIDEDPAVRVLDFLTSLASAQGRAVRGEGGCGVVIIDRNAGASDSPGTDLLELGSVTAGGRVLKNILEYLADYRPEVVKKMARLARARGGDRPVDPFLADVCHAYSAQMR